MIEHGSVTLYLPFLIYISTIRIKTELNFGFITNIIEKLFPTFSRLFSPFEMFHHNQNYQQIKVWLNLKVDLSPEEGLCFVVETSGFSSFQTQIFNRSNILIYVFYYNVMSSKHVMKLKHSHQTKISELIEVGVETGSDTGFSTSYIST